MIGARWGVTEAETRLPFACDDLVGNSPALVAWRGVTVNAPPEVVWSWVGQVRIAPYSYDWLDNLGRRSPRDLAGLPEPRVGEPFTRSGGRPLGRLVAVEPGRQLTGEILGAFLSYLVVPLGENGTRLLLKVVMDTRRVLAPFLSVGDLVMARRQLLNLKACAEAGVPS
ncbi:MAG TPA: SRPBCC family protein [Pedococcus sp.]|nr:SRPBCC family protein [Pedococcus sp.]